MNQVLLSILDKTSICGKKALHYNSNKKVFMEVQHMSELELNGITHCFWQINA